MQRRRSPSRCLDIPKPISDASNHGGRNLQRLIDAAGVLVHEVQRDRVRVVLDLLREGVGQASETPYGHARRQVLALDVGSGDMLGIGIALDPLHLGADALRRAALGLMALPSAVVAAQLDELDIVYIPAECALDRLKVCLVHVPVAI